MSEGANGGPPRQRTLAGSASVEGIALHSGVETTATIGPGDTDAGFVFRRGDLENAPAIKANLDSIAGVAWETVIGSGEAVVRTIEHLLAAFSALRIDNAEVSLIGGEPPALDGSSAVWCDLIEKIGVVEQDAEARVLKITEPIYVEDEDSRYTVSPYPGFRVSAEIDFEHPTIGRQFASTEVTAEEFSRTVAPARTFGLADWQESLNAKGLALGANMENTVVVTDGGLAEGTELRFPDEFVRHKIIDIIGDLALVGARIEGHVLAERPSHRGNVALARRLEGMLWRAPDGAPALAINKIMEYMPHRYPMLLIDRVLEFEPGKRLRGLKNVTVNEPFFAGHFPGHPIMPGVLIVEAMAQAGGLLLMNEFDDPESRVVYFMSLDNVKFRRPVLPGDQLIFELEMLQFRGRVCRMQGIASVDGKVVAEATMMARVVDK
jgi:UDP-3-O-[3-hydroxymyristoyl] N-acetylglucosamine deacetylase/3-hydroxyacyl-[acyl-carrier-protein] dehydratase